MNPTDAVAVDGDPRPNMASAPLGEVGGIPFTRLYRAELRKSVDTRAGRWLLVAIAVITAATLALVVAFGEGEGLAFTNLLAFTVMPQMLLLPVLGVLTATAEWSQRTGMTTFTLEPRRTRVILAKAVAVSTLAVAAVAVAFLCAAAAHLIAIGARGFTPSWSIEAGLVGGILLTQLLSVVQGVAFGLAIGNTAAAIVTFFLLPMAWSMAGALVSGLRTAAEWLDPGVTMVPLYTGAMTADAWLKLGTSMALWVAVPVGLGLWMLHRREVK